MKTYTVGENVSIKVRHTNRVKGSMMTTNSVETVEATILSLWNRDIPEKTQYFFLGDTENETLFGTAWSEHEMEQTPEEHKLFSREQHIWRLPNYSAFIFKKCLESAEGLGFVLYKKGEELVRQHVIELYRRS